MPVSHRSRHHGLNWTPVVQSATQLNPLVVAKREYANERFNIRSEAQQRTPLVLSLHAVSTN